MHQPQAPSPVIRRALPRVARLAAAAARSHDFPRRAQVHDILHLHPRHRRASDHAIPIALRALRALPRGVPHRDELPERASRVSLEPSPALPRERLPQPVPRARPTLDPDRARRLTAIVIMIPTVFHRSRPSHRSRRSRRSRRVPSSRPVVAPRRRRASSRRARDRAFHLDRSRARPFDVSDRFAVARFRSDRRRASRRARRARFDSTRVGNRRNRRMR